MYRVGVIGCRGIGVRHAAGIAMFNDPDRAAVVAACDLVTDEIDAFKGEFPDTEITGYTDHRQMLEKENLDIVTVATSDHAHTALVVDAAEAGAKGIFCEKPLATTVEDAAAMVAACERHGVVISVDHTRRWTPIWRHGKELVDAGEIGQVQYVIGALRGHRAMLYRNGTHCIDSTCWFAGGRPVWVTGDLEEGYDDYTEYAGDGGHVPATEPGANAYIKFDNGVGGFYVGGSKKTPEPKFGTEVVGSSGRLIIDSNESATLYRGTEAEVIPAPEWPVSGIEAGVQDLVQILEQGGTESISTGRDGQAVVEVIAAILASHQAGHAPIQIPQAR